LVIPSKTGRNLVFITGTGYLTENLFSYKAIYLKTAQSNIRQGKIIAYKIDIKNFGQNGGLSLIRDKILTFNRLKLALNLI